MIAGVREYREVYCQEVGKHYEVRWFLCHVRRMLERANELGMTAEILIGAIPYEPHNFEELQEIWQEISEKLTGYINDGHKVFCRIIYKT